MKSKRQQTMWLRVGILLAMFALALTSLRDKSPTFDEQGFLTRGVAYLQGENRNLRVGHPLGLNALNGAFLSIDDQITLPTEDPSWQGTNFHRPSELFLWEIGNDVERVMFQGRLPTIWLAMFLVAIAGRWARELTKMELAGVLAMLLLALDPNILAHSRLATTDLGLAAAATLAGYLLWRFWKRPSWVRAAVAGGAFGLLMNTKFTAGLFVPLFTLVILVAFLDRWRKHRGAAESKRDIWRPLLQLVVCYPLAGLLVLWASYGFQIGTLPDSLPVLSQLSGTTWPASHYLEQLLDIGGRLQKSTPAFLLGQYSDSGWWYYFPVAYLLKTPLPTLILLSWALVRLILCGFGRLKAKSCLSVLDVTALLVPAAGYFAFALTTDINLGYRHLLPILPFLAVFTAAMLSQIKANRQEEKSRASLSRVALAALVLALGIIALWIYPHYLTYFNVLAGGPDGGWQALVDSNIDWGQDLAGLKGWMDENEVEQVSLSYFGEGRPEYYGINYIGLDSFPPRLMNPAANPYYAADPAPGIYAISATTLQGVHFENHDQFAWFRSEEPVDKIGNSIFLYQVPANGEAVDVVLGGLQLGDIVPNDYGLWASNDVSAHWFDASQSLVLPKNKRVWLAMAKDTTVHPRIAQEIEPWTIVADRSDYRLYRQPEELAYGQMVRAEFENSSSRLVLNRAVYDWRGATAGDNLDLETLWTKHGQSTAVKLFLHLTDEEGGIVAQWDGLGAAWEGLRDGDRLLQLHQMPVPEELKPGLYQVWIGVYDPATARRWLAGDQDRLLLDEIVIPE